MLKWLIFPKLARIDWFSLVVASVADIVIMLRKLDDISK
jgi:hypothetical protein